MIDPLDERVVSRSSVGLTGPMFAERAVIIGESRGLAAGPALPLLVSLLERPDELVTREALRQRPSTSSSGERGRQEAAHNAGRFRGVAAIRRDTPAAGLSIHRSGERDDSDRPGLGPSAPDRVAKNTSTRYGNRPTRPFSISATMARGSDRADGGAVGRASREKEQPAPGNQTANGGVSRWPGAAASSYNGVNPGQSASVANTATTVSAVSVRDA